MSVLTALQAANTQAGITGLSFANLQEFNSFMDSFQFTDYPRNIVVPFNLDGIFLNNRAKTTINIHGWVLTRITQDTNDWRSLQLEPLYIDPMRTLAMKFIKALINNEDDITIDPEIEPVRFNIKPEYMFLPAHLFGVSYSVNLPGIDHVC